MKGHDDDLLASATITDAEDAELGSVDVEETDGGLQITADLSDLEPGYSWTDEPDPTTSAGPCCRCRGPAVWAVSASSARPAGRRPDQ